MRLRTYIIRKLLFVISTFFFVSLLIFAVINARPLWGDGIVLLGWRPPEMFEHLIRKWGLDQPFFARYLMWMSRFFQGDLGFSFVRMRPVSDMIAQRVSYTLELMFMAQIVSVSIAIVLGVISAVEKYSLAGSLSSLGARIGYLTPNFWVALMAILVFSVGLGWFPVGGAQTSDTTFASPLHAWADHLAYLTLPVSVLALSWMAYYFRIVKSSMLGVMERDYITTARAKGLKERVVVFKHALSNALLSLLKYESYFVGFLLSGAVVIEWIFVWPGLGHLFVESLWLRDYFVLWGSSMIIVLFVLLVSAFADIAYATLNPRIRRA